MMAPEIQDPRMTTIHPRIRYNTIGGINGPLVILENVCQRYIALLYLTLTFKSLLQR